MTTPQPGDEVYLGSVLVNMHCWGIVGDIDTPPLTTSTMEVVGQDGAITMPVLIGPRGVPGQNASIVKMQYGSSIDDPADLPQNLTDTDTDKGKAWWIGNVVYMWDGTQYVAKEMGTMGPAGPVPNVTPALQVVTGDVNFVDTIDVSGTAANPGWLFKVNGERIRGPQGDNATIRDATDYSEVTSGPPQTGDVIAWNGSDFEPRQQGTIMPRLYTVPEANFQSFSGLTSRQQIAAYAIPPQEFPWVPYVTGHIRAFGLEADTDPLILGCEVRLGDPVSGQLIARGFGNSSTWTTIVPHVSTTQSTNDAITPDNGVAVVQAAHTDPAEGTIYVNLFNDGAMGAYVFNKNQAQISVLVIPV